MSQFRGSQMFFLSREACTPCPPSLHTGGRAHHQQWNELKHWPFPPSGLLFYFPPWWRVIELTGPQKRPQCWRHFEVGRRKDSTVHSTSILRLSCVWPHWGKFSLFWSARTKGLGKHQGGEQLLKRVDMLELRLPQPLWAENRTDRAMSSTQRKVLNLDLAMHL